MYDSLSFYSLLILPSFIGLTMVADGLGRLMKIKVQVNPWFSVFYGFAFVGVAVFSYIYFRS